MARKQPQFKQTHLQHNLDRWFALRRKIFVYHYECQPEIDPQWRDLSTTGCCYRGWIMMANCHRGEIWTYPTQKHLMLVQMLVPRDTLINAADWQRLKQESRRDNRKWQREIQGLIKSNAQTHTWWGEER